ncbi:unnamed protein product [Phytophthora lilii]|uniref:Unnamed protein product n=1 Tax=Phytophthora lilii TaxID=2077276 RepID=A0A9W6WLX4_9STRA|nr:unnamed protein product [Phytophthora lilii]
MSLAARTCSCGLHDALQRSSRAATGALQCTGCRGTGSDALGIEGGEYQDDGEEDQGSGGAAGHEDCDEHEYEREMMSREREEAEAVVATMQLQIRALRKYKTNYELLCSQLSELNAQIGLQLQRHEADVAALQGSIADLQTEKLALEEQVSELQQALTAQRDATTQDREYSESVHRQLTTAAELLKATERRLEQQELELTEEVKLLKTQLAVGDDERVKLQLTVKGLEEELGKLRVCATAAKEKEALRKRHEKIKHKRELMARAAKLRAVSDELETQRSALRASKKQLVQLQAENDALRKQLANTKRDGAHLTDIIDSQRVEKESHAEDLLQVKKENKQLSKRIALLSQEVKQLQSDLIDAKEELTHRSDELETCQTELKGMRAEYQQAAQELEDAQANNDKLRNQVEVLRSTEHERIIKAKAQEQQASRERQYRKEFIRMRELLADNQQRASESSKDVQKLRRELLSVQKLLHGSTEEKNNAPEPIDRWAEVMQNSVISE